jgi:uncharacterized protein (TIGR03067 family)
MSLGSTAYVLSIALSLACIGCGGHSDTLCDKDASFDGRWMIVSIQDRGKASAFRDVENSQIDVRGQQLTFVDSSGPQTKILRLGPPGCARSIDIIQGPEAKGWSRIGIFRISNGEALLCLTYQGMARPKTFCPYDEAHEEVQMRRLSSEVVGGGRLAP